MLLTSVEHSGEETATAAGSGGVGWDGPGHHREFGSSPRPASGRRCHGGRTSQRRSSRRVVPEPRPEAVDQSGRPGLVLLLLLLCQVHVGQPGLHGYTDACVDKQKF